MAEKKVTIQFPQIAPGPLPGNEVPILESTDKWSEVTLEDGTILRFKPNVLKVVRLDGHWDPEGNPMYVVNQTVVMTVANCPDRLRKPAEQSKAVN